MGDVEQKRRRRRNLLAADPHCHWCVREVRDYDMPQPKIWPPDMATLDHLQSRVQYPDGRPKTRLYVASRREVWYVPVPTTVLACYPCNTARARDEKLGREDWTPGCRQPGLIAIRLALEAVAAVLCTRTQAKA